MKNDTEQTELITLNPETDSFILIQVADNRVERTVNKLSRLETVAHLEIAKQRLIAGVKVECES